MFDIKKLRNLRLQYNDTKGELGDLCKEINDTAKFLGFEQPQGKEDVRCSLAFVEGVLKGIQYAREGK